MNLTEEQLKEVETMAGLFFEPEKIAIMLGLNPVDDMDDFKEKISLGYPGEIYIAYWRGRLRAETELRTAIKHAALNGSFSLCFLP